MQFADLTHLPDQPAAVSAEVTVLARTTSQSIVLFSQNFKK